MSISVAYLMHLLFFCFVVVIVNIAQTLSVCILVLRFYLQMAWTVNDYWKWQYRESNQKSESTINIIEIPTTNVGF